MAASSGLATSFALKSRVHGVGTAFSSASLVRLHGGAMMRICRQRRGGVSLVSPRCEASGFDNDSLIKSIWPSATSADSLKYSRERCSIVAIVLCGPSTPVETREKLAIVESEWPRAIEELCKLEDIEEASVLSTCSRVEIYVLALCQDHGVSQVTDWISKSSGVPVSELCKHRVVLCNKDAVEHLFEVSSGLDSLVLGESQILASLEQVWSVGIGVKGSGRVVNELFWFAAGVGKRVRSETSIGAGGVCVSSAAVELALMKLSSSSLAMARMLVVGAGEMGKRVIQHLVARGCKKVVVVTRNELSVKEEMKGGVEIIYKPVSEMYDCAAAADVVFTTTTSRKPIFLRQHVEKLPPAQQLVVGAGGSRLFIDISVPRNVGSCVANLETARVYNVDDLKQFVEANKDDRLIPEAMMKAWPIINEETNNFELLWNSWTFFTLENLRAMVEEMRIEWLEERLAEFGDDITETQRKAIEGDSRAWSHNRLKKVRAFFSRIELQLGSPEVPFRLDFDSIITLLDR